MDSVSKVNPIAKGVMHAIARPEAFVIVVFMAALEVGKFNVR
ncbi:hypothetical protein [Pseudomonas guariconensis]